MLDDGIADITKIQESILINDPATSAAYPDMQQNPIRRTDLANAKHSARRLLPSTTGPQPPTTPPKIAAGTDQGGICAAFSDLATPPAISIEVTLPPVGAGVHMAGSKVDEVVVAPGSGVLVQSAISAEAVAGTLAVVTDLGVRYSLASHDVLGYLGYTTGSITNVPASLVALLPQGPALDPATAASPAPIG